MAVLLILAIALLIDSLAGEPPNAFHPVVGMGRIISVLSGRCSARSPRLQLACGFGITVFAVAAFAVPVYFLLAYLENISTIAYVAVGAVLLKSTFSLRQLRRVVLDIQGLLEKNLDRARSALRALVSRDTSSLPRPLLVSAAVESTAESACDSFVAPLFFFLIFGVPGALAYRCVNTLDSMIGYHGKYEYVGKFPSRLDDVLNYIPARITAMLVVAAAFFSGRDYRRSWRVALGEHGQTDSPNAGWPMAAAAGALGVRLEKVGQYRLGKGSPPAPRTIGDVVGLVGVAAALWMLVCYGVEVILLVY